MTLAAAVPGGGPATAVGVGAGAGAGSGGGLFTDPCDVRLALGAGGVLGVFNGAGVLSAADVHVAVRLGRFGPEGDDRVLLAAALAVSGQGCLLYTSDAADE